MYNMAVDHHLSVINGVFQKNWPNKGSNMLRS